MSKISYRNQNWKCTNLQGLKLKKWTYKNQKWKNGPKTYLSLAYINEHEHETMTNIHYQHSKLAHLMDINYCIIMIQNVKSSLKKIKHGNFKKIGMKPYQGSSSNDFSMGIMNNITTSSQERTSKALCPRSHCNHLQILMEK